jgi:hypothetical protein
MADRKRDPFEYRQRATHPAAADLLRDLLLLREELAGQYGDAASVLSAGRATTDAEDVAAALVIASDALWMAAADSGDPELDKLAARVDRAAERAVNIALGGQES